MIHIDNDHGVLKVEGCMKDLLEEWQVLTGTLHRMFADKMGAETTNAMFTQGLFVAVAGSESIADDEEGV